MRMVSAFYGREISEFELEESCETGWLGNTCGELVQCIKNFGFDSEEIENATIDYLSGLFEEEGIPLIALIDPAVLYGGIMGFGHFIVITGHEGDKIYYHDPDMEKNLSKDADEFFNAWEKFSFKGVKIWKSMKK